MSAVDRADTVPASLSARALSTVRWSRHFQPILLIITDVATASLAFGLAYVLRYHLELGGDVVGESYVPYPVYLPVQFLFVAVCLFDYQIRRGYTAPRGLSLAAEALSISGSAAVAAILVFTLVSMASYPAQSRLTFIFAWLLTISLGVVGRLIVRVLRTQVYRAGHGVERVIVVGNNRLARMTMQMLNQRAHLGYRVLGFVDDMVRTDFGRFRALGGVRSLPQVIEQHRADRVIVALPASQHNEILWVLDHCQRDGVSFSLVPDLFELRLSHVQLDTVSGIPLFGLSDAGIAGGKLVMKHLLDGILAAMALIVLSPVLAVVALAIKLEDGGPILFRQLRYGRNATPFVCLKFRSMCVDAEQRLAELIGQNEADGPLFKMRDDPRLTRVGRIIRRISIDELPQLWNVVRGEMSLVGPRPPIPAEVEQYEDWHRRRLEVVPGITGLWQVSGRSELSFDEMVMLDIFYIENWSLSLDLQILARTLPAVFARSGAF